MPLDEWVRSRTVEGRRAYHWAGWSRQFTVPQPEASMIWLAVLLVIAWLLGWGVFHVAGGLIHILLVIAVVVFLINFISGRRTV